MTHACRPLLPLLTAATLISAADAAADPPRGILTAPNVNSLHLLSQNWTDGEANSFYNAAQGSQILPYSWFLHLEQADSETAFRDVEYFRKLGYLPRAPSPSDNPDGLPVGFVRDGLHLGITCAACHTSQINFQGEAWLVDGAPTHGDIEKLQRALVEALQKTADTDAKFDRFSAAILGAGATANAKSKLRDEVRKMAVYRREFNTRNLPLAGAPPFGPGRMDAFGVIMNEVSSTIAQLPDNHFPADAPVSYPFLWDTPQHDFVQWNGAAENTESSLISPVVGTRHVGALGRNVGEVVGAFGKVDASSAGILGLSGYPSSINKNKLIQIEEMVRKLWSPQWPSQLGSIDPDLQSKGKGLFEEHCAKCHDSIDRTSPGRRVVAKMDDVGTDRTMAANFAERKARSGRMKGRVIVIPGLRRFKEEASMGDLLTHVVQRAILGPGAFELNMAGLIDSAPKFVINAEVQIGGQTRLIGSFSSLETAGLQGRVREVLSRDELHLKVDGDFLTQDIRNFEDAGQFITSEGLKSAFNLGQLPKITSKTSPAGTLINFTEPAVVKYRYKGRPLNGIWATAPYLHNGSVPNLAELLKPAAKRMKTFKVGSREFDPAQVGFSTTEGDADFNTALPGNSNAGHEYPKDREFSEEERLQLIEYMKSL